MISTFLYLISFFHWPLSNWCMASQAMIDQKKELLISSSLSSVSPPVWTNASTIQMPASVRAGPGRSLQELRTQPRTPSWVAKTLVVNHYLLLPRLHIGRKLISETGSGLELILILDAGILSAFQPLCQMPTTHNILESLLDQYIPTQTILSVLQSPYCYICH